MEIENDLDEDRDVNPNKFISKEEAAPDSRTFRQQFACPNCGSYNTGQSTYTDFCKTCDWVQTY